MSRLINSCCPVFYKSGYFYQFFIDEYVTFYYVSVYNKTTHTCYVSQKISKKEYKLLDYLIDYIYNNRIH